MFKKSQKQNLISLLAQAFASVKKHLQEIWHTSLLKRRQDHQRPPDGPKDKDHITNKSGIIYRYKCDRVECNEEYIRESARTFGERFREHLKHPSPIYDHSNITGHSTTLDNSSIVGRDDQNHEADKGSYRHKGQQSMPEQKHRQIPSASYMGWGSE